MRLKINLLNSRAAARASTPLYDSIVVVRATILGVNMMDEKYQHA